MRSTVRPSYEPPTTRISERRTPCFDRDISACRHSPKLFRFRFRPTWYRPRATDRLRAEIRPPAPAKRSSTAGFQLATHRVLTSTTLHPPCHLDHTMRHLDPHVLDSGSNLKLDVSARESLCPESLGNRLQRTVYFFTKEIMNPSSKPDQVALKS